MKKLVPAVFHLPNYQITHLPNPLNSGDFGNPGNFGNHCGPPPSPPGAPRFHPESNAAAPEALGDAVRIGSTPLKSVIAVTSEPPVPAVDTIITASSFCNSAGVTAGNLPIICWKSIAPPPGRPPPGPPAAPGPGPPAAGDDPFPALP